MALRAEQVSHPGSGTASAVDAVSAGAASEAQYQQSLPGQSEGGAQTAAAATPIDTAESGSTNVDWLEQVCPYLLSEDGTWRSTQPDPGHRCMAQDPPGELPPMFQERFCLTDRHVRCEWFKAAQTSPPNADGSSGMEPIQSAQTAPSPRSGGGPSRPVRPILIAAAFIGGFLVLVLIALLFGSGDGSTDVGASPAATASAGSDSTPRPTSATGTIVPIATPAPTAAPALPEILIQYEVQADERLIRIANRFGTRRQDIYRVNKDLDAEAPKVEVGQIVLVPVSGEMSRRDIRAVPGFVAFVDVGEG